MTVIFQSREHRPEDMMSFFQSTRGQQFALGRRNKTKNVSDKHGTAIFQSHEHRPEDMMSFFQSTRGQQSAMGRRNKTKKVSDKQTCMLWHV